MDKTDKTPNEELRELIVENRALIAKMKKMMNGMLVIAGIVFIPFFYSFVDINVRVSGLEEKMMPKDDVYRLFVQKVDALAVHMMEDEWKRTQLYAITKDPKYKEDQNTVTLIKAFFGEERRGTE